MRILNSFLKFFYTLILISIPILSTFSFAQPLKEESPSINVLHTIDFSKQEDGDATNWLKNNGFKFRVKGISPRFSNKRLLMETEEQKTVYISKTIEVKSAKRVRVYWGVERYPEGADWENGVFRVPIAVMISFGYQKIESGAFFPKTLFVKNAPRFISLFLGEKEQEGLAYTATYYKKGGRYFCKPCGISPGQNVVITDFNLEEAFLKEFKLPKMPPVTSFGFQMNTKNTIGGAKAFLVKVEFLSD